MLLALSDVATVQIGLPLGGLTVLLLALGDLRPPRTRRMRVVLTVAALVALVGFVAVVALRVREMAG